MKGFLIDPFDRTLTSVDLPASIPKLLGCDMITAAGLPNGDAVYVDDEGLLKGATAFFLLDGLYPQPLAGKGLVVGTDDEGNDIEPLTTEDELRDALDFGQPMQIGGLLMFMGDRTRRIIA